MLSAVQVLSSGVLPDLADPGALLGHALPLTLVLAAWLGGRATTSAAAWRTARGATVLALLLAISVLTTRLLAPAAPDGWRVAFAAVLVLVAFIGVVITRYAGTYLEGEARQPAFVRWLCLTLAGSSLVVATDHLGVLVGAWVGTSLALGNLLVFYRDRPQAQMAAHKKFLVSRAADACMVAAAALLAVDLGTLQLGELAGIADADGVSALSSVAVVLIALAALLKSAQLPFHGWLMQVMEAPTPVSALLHAGVVNLGGFVLIRLGALVMAEPIAQVLLVVAGSLTAVLAVLAMSTRVSIKVALAWSTCAQMGFMVMQCGLGLFEMALLHLIAHSLYKAHAFLSSGETVQRALVSRMTPRPAPCGLTTRLGLGALALAATLGFAWLVGIDLLEESALAAMLVVLSGAMSPLLIAGAARERWLQGLVAAAALAALWLGLHQLLHSALPKPAPRQGALAAGELAVVLSAWVAVLFSGLFVVRSLTLARPDGALAVRLYDLFYGGLFLDEWFTRLTLRIWPVQRGSRAELRGPLAEEVLDR